MIKRIEQENFREQDDHLNVSWMAVNLSSSYSEFFYAFDLVKAVINLLEGKSA